jgi:hypothetical protein
MQSASALNLELLHQHMCMCAGRHMTWQNTLRLVRAVRLVRAEQLQAQYSQRLTHPYLEWLTQWVLLWQLCRLHRLHPAVRQLQLSAPSGGASNQQLTPCRTRHAPASVQLQGEIAPAVTCGDLPA